jgi:hypothetical protein
VSLTMMGMDGCCSAAGTGSTRAETAIAANKPASLGQKKELHLFVEVTGLPGLSGAQSRVGSKAATERRWGWFLFIGDLSWYDVKTDVF